MADGTERGHVSRMSRPDRRMLWYGTLPAAVRPLAELLASPVDFAPYVGLLEPVLGENILAVCASGVGGGSLVYQGMTLRPSEDVFRTWLPEQLDYRRMDRIRYPRVARMLRTATAPDRLVDASNYSAARLFAERVRRAGYGLEKIPMPIDWDYALAELRGEMKPSYTNGDCALGVNNGGKHSVDVTYLKHAEATGKVTVATHRNVTGVARGPGALTDTNLLVNSTWHPLGGAPMGTVCDLEGRVHGQRGLYVLDGALIPGTTGACNPSMTIAAVAERAMDAIVARDVGTII